MMNISSWRQQLCVYAIWLHYFLERVATWPTSAPCLDKILARCRFWVVIEAPAAVQDYITARATYYTRWPLDTVGGQVQHPIYVTSIKHTDQILQKPMPLCAGPDGNGQKCGSAFLPCVEACHDSPEVAWATMSRGVIARFSAALPRRPRARALTPRVRQVLGDSLRDLGADVVVIAETRMSTMAEMFDDSELQAAAAAVGQQWSAEQHEHATLSAKFALRGVTTRTIKCT